MPTRLLRDCTDSEHFDGLSAEAERQFYRLIMKADDYGRFPADWRRVKSACFPLCDYSENQINSWLNELEKHSIIGFYEVDGRKYLAIPKFGQRLKHSVPKCPAFPGKSNNWLADYADFRELSGKFPEVPAEAHAHAHANSDVEEKRWEEPPSADNHVSNSDTPFGPDEVTAPAEPTEDPFDRFWRIYPKSPRKTDKKKCRVIWDREKLDARIDEIIGGLKKWKTIWEKDGGKFIPLVTTWLNGARWEDAPDVPDAHEEIDLAEIGIVPHRNLTDEELKWLGEQMADREVADG